MTAEISVFTYRVRVRVRVRIRVRVRVRIAPGVREEACSGTSFHAFLHVS